MIFPCRNKSLGYSVLVVSLWCPGSFGDFSPPERYVSKLTLPPKQMDEASRTHTFSG